MIDAVLLASLCGCLVQHISTDAHVLVLDLDERRLGHLQLRCDVAEILSPATHANLEHRPTWARVIDWADTDPDQHVQLTFADRTDLVIRAASYQLTRVAG